MIRVLGSRLYLANAISNLISKFLNENEYDFKAEDWNVYDLFAGTGILCESLFDYGFRKFRLNDICCSTYYVLSSHWEMGKGDGCQMLYNYLTNSPKDYVCDWNIRMVYIFEYLNNLQGVEGQITKYYTEIFSEDTRFFSIQNAMMIDAIRQKIEEWSNLHIINSYEYRYLIGNLLECADEVANIKFKWDTIQRPMLKNSLNSMIWKPFGLFVKNPDSAKSVYFENSNKKEYSLTRFKSNNSLTKDCVTNLDAEYIQINDDGKSFILLDPPNNVYDYRNLLHLPITISLYDNPPKHGKANLRPVVKKNNFHNKKTYTIALRTIFDNTYTKYVFYFVPLQERKGIVDIDDIHDMIISYGFNKVTWHLVTDNMDTEHTRLWRFEAPNAKLFRLYCIKR